MKAKSGSYSVIILSFALIFGTASGQVTTDSGKEPLDSKIEGMLGQAQSALDAKNWPEAKNLYQQLVTADPSRWEFYQGLGDAQLNMGQFEDSIRTYEKGIQLAQKALSAPGATKVKTGIGHMLTQTANAYLKLRRNNEAVAAYAKAAEISPNPGLAYFNLCATQYNLGNMEEAEKTCGKAIAIDPNRADAYFIQGSAMFVRGNLGPDNKYVAPPGTADVLKKYLELSPNGKFSKDVKEMLGMIGVK